MADITYTLTSKEMELVRSTVIIAKILTDRDRENDPRSIIRRHWNEQSIEASQMINKCEMNM